MSRALLFSGGDYVPVDFMVTLGETESQNFIGFDSISDPAQGSISSSAFRGEIIAAVVATETPGVQIYFNSIDLPKSLFWRMTLDDADGSPVEFKTADAVHENFAGAYTVWSWGVGSPFWTDADLAEVKDMRLE